MKLKDTYSFGSKVMTNLDSILKSRSVTLSTKLCLVKAVVFPVVMYGCESWTIKKAESRRIDTFELWCWRRFLRVPWTTRRSNQSILKEISAEHSLEGLMLKLKLQYFGHLMQRADSCEKTLMLGKIDGRRRRNDRGWDGWMASPIQWTWVWINSDSWWWTARPGMLQFMGSQRIGPNWATELKWTEAKISRTTFSISFFFLKFFEVLGQNLFPFFFFQFFRGHPHSLAHVLSLPSSSTWVILHPSNHLTVVTISL